jgi:ArsR family transcriptional regulator, arsenate/arsenite/antimonite-responsive transcriptional repressor
LPAGRPAPLPALAPTEIVEENSAELLARTFKALGDPARVRLLSLVAAAPDGEACICDLTEPVGFTVVQPALDRLAGVLRRAE